VFVKVTMLDDSNVDTERLGMTKMRMTRMMTDGYTQTHHQYSVIQIQLNELSSFIIATQPIGSNNRRHIQ